LHQTHLTHGTLVLYEGCCCPLAKRGYSRDGRKGTLQIVYGLLCAPDGCPVAIEVFEGNTADPMTLASQVDKLKQRFHLDHVVLVGDRGMITQARITEDIKWAGIAWITAPRAPATKALLENGTLQLSPFDQRDLVRIQAAVARRRDPLRGTAEIALAVGAVINRYKMAKHFDLDITDAGFSFTRKAAEIAAEAASDGIYVVRTSLPAESFDDATTVRSYKSLALVDIDQAWRLSRLSRYTKLRRFGRSGDQRRQAAPRWGRSANRSERRDRRLIGVQQSELTSPDPNRAAG
jgi:hypothetical protein